LIDSKKNLKKDFYYLLIITGIRFRDIGVTSPQRRRTLSNIKYPHRHKNSIFSISRQEQENGHIEERTDRSKLNLTEHF
jgi:hypothetical protein